MNARYFDIDFHYDVTLSGCRGISNVSSTRQSLFVPRYFAEDVFSCFWFIALPEEH